MNDKLLCELFRKCFSERLTNLAFVTFCWPRLLGHVKIVVYLNCSQIFLRFVGAEFVGVIDLR